MNNQLASELALLTRLIYSNKNQHHAAIWFRRATEVKRWATKLLQQQRTTTFLDQVRPTSKPHAHIIHSTFNLKLTHHQLYHSKFSKDCLHGYRNHIHSLLCQNTLNH
ncbi:hypothetical protein VP01_2531g1 [Puccinia sorghi]|uniref:Uncharacterized protein n=1 Tax=Puccinia sorghi TaxID=27349 RepID=A0A0L6V5H3_9BASI|nr:hypothetical protein VP01_2531g1 [Puccinia sorghi]